MSGWFKFVLGWLLMLSPFVITMFIGSKEWLPDNLIACGVLSIVLGLLFGIPALILLLLAIHDIARKYK